MIRTTRITRHLWSFAVVLLLLGSTLLGCLAAPSTALSTTPPPLATWQPTPGTSWQIQLQGDINTSINAEVYVIDLFDSPQTVIDELHDTGRKVICYFSAGSWEDWRADADEFPIKVRGEALEGWPGEYWLDIRHAETRRVMATRLDLAVQKQCDGVDPDNVDGYTHDTAFPLTSDDQLDYNRWLAAQAAARNLAIGLKNDMAQIPQLVDDFDWVINEQCFAYDECALLQPFIDANKPVFSIEYTGDREAICPRANALNFDTLFKSLDLRDEWYSCRHTAAATSINFLPYLMLARD